MSMLERTQFEARLRTNPKSNKDDQGEPLKETIRRVKRFSCAIKIAFTESEYERTIEELKDQNRVLRQFYDDAQRLRCLGSEEKRVATTKTAPRLSSIRRASAKLHDALTDTDLMTFDRPAAVKLCLEAKEVGAAICLDLVICKTQLLADCTQKYVQHASAEDLLIALCNRVSVFPLRQITVEAVELNDNTKVSMLETGRKRGHGELSPSVPAKSRKIAGAHGTKLLNDQKNVASSFMLLGPDLNGLDLTMHKNIYHELMHKACKSTTSETYCPGLYETSTDSYKHVFHSSMECSMRACCSPIVPRSASILSLHEALQKPMHEIIGMTDRLKLAKSLALGLLQFHGTGWLTEQWSSRDVAIFSEDGQFSGNALRSLHYTKALPNSLQSLLRQESEAAEKENSKSGERDVATIRNLELYNLGVQLLRIAQWSELDDMNPTKAREIIKKQSIHPPLGGQKYFNFARRCIECDFGYGDRLDDPDLQRAVYAGVEDINQLIEELEKLGL